MNLVMSTIDSPVGELRIVASEDALHAVLWPDEREGRVVFAADVSPGQNKITRATAQQLAQYFAGERRSFDLPLAMAGTEFQELVWRSLAEIPFGETASYSKQATTIGRPKAIRAVGSANGRNPLSIVLPCHRIVAANGSLAGFAGGLDTKQWLLEHEAAVAAR